MENYFFTQYGVMQNKGVKKEINKRITAAMLISAFMMVLLLLFDKYFYDIIYYASYAAGHIAAYLNDSDSEKAIRGIYELIVFNEGYFFTARIIINIFFLVFPFYILAKASRIKFSDGFKYNYKYPEKTPLYIPFVIGCCYIISIIATLISDDFVLKFDAAPIMEIPETVAGIILSYVLVCAVPAFFEEWAFRGILIRYLAPCGKWTSVLISAFIFGAMHIEPANVIFAIFFGIMTGYTFVKTGSVWYGVAMHMLINAISLTGSYIIQQNGVDYQNLENSQMDVRIFILSALIFSAIIIAIISGAYYLSKNKLTLKTTVNNFSAPESADPGGFKKLNSFLFNGGTAVFVFAYVLTYLYRFG